MGLSMIMVVRMKQIVRSLSSRAGVVCVVVVGDVIVFVRRNRWRNEGFSSTIFVGVFFF